MRGLGWIWVWIGVLLIGCGEKEHTVDTPLSELMDPKACAECHPDHYREWSGSMHAYAAEDPVFLAMNARGQRETHGEMGDFCVRCHAPLAVEEGLTTDGLNLDEVPDIYKGVTCYYCHQITAVEGQSNNPLRIAWDKMMRGGIKDPVQNTFHQASYSPYLDRTDLKSADACGACHDIVSPKGAHIERTYKEWQESLYSSEGIFQLSCAQCHMRSREGVVADYPGVKFRRVRDHSFAAVDLALTPFPNLEEQKALVQRELDNTLLAQLCLFEAGDSTSRIEVYLENVGAGHSFPSGAAADRRVWVEIIAYDGDEPRWSTGVVPDGERVVDHQENDANFWLFRDILLNDDGEETHMFWEAADYRSRMFDAPYYNEAGEIVEGHEVQGFTIDFTPTRVTTRVRIRAIGLDVLDDLIQSGDLDPAIRDAVQTLDLRTTVLEWRAEQNETCVGE